MTPEAQAREIVWVEKNEIDGAAYHVVRHTQDIERLVAAALAERDREIERVTQENLRLSKTRSLYRIRGFTPDGKLDVVVKPAIGMLKLEKQCDILRAQRDALVEVLELYVDRHDSDWTSSTRGRETACPCRTCDAARAALSAGKGEG